MKQDLSYDEAIKSFEGIFAKITAYYLSKNFICESIERGKVKKSKFYNRDDSRQRRPLNLGFLESKNLSNLERTLNNLEGVVQGPTIELPLDKGMIIEVGRGKTDKSEIIIPLKTDDPVYKHLNLDYVRVLTLPNYLDHIGENSEKRKQSRQRWIPIQLEISYDNHTLYIDEDNNLKYTNLVQTPRKLYPDYLHHSTTAFWLVPPLKQQCGLFNDFYGTSIISLGDFPIDLLQNFCYDKTPIQTQAILMIKYNPISHKK